MHAKAPSKPIKETTAVDSLLEKCSKVASSRITYVACIVLIAALAFLVRLLPLKWGAYLSEFDPYWHYYVAKYAVDNGFPSVFGWVDTRTWYPAGRIVAVNTPLGLPFTAAAFYIFLHGLGLPVSLLDVSIYLPPVMAAVAVITLYYLGKDLGGREVGLIAGLFLAFNSAYISRTTLGFFKHESVGIFAIVLASLLFLRAVNPDKSFRKSLGYAFVAGLALAYLNISWGASYFMLGLIPLFAFVMVVIRRYSPRILTSYAVAMTVSILLTLPFPRPGLQILTASEALPAVAVFILLVAYEPLRRVRGYGGRKLFPIILCVVVAAVIAAVLYQGELITPLSGRVAAVVNPSLRATNPAGPIVESVAEHRMSTWAMFYYGFGNLIFFAPLGFLFAFRRRRASDIYLILFGILSLYFAATFVRLNLILAPAFCLLAAYGIVSLARPLKEAVKGLVPRVRARLVTPSVSPRLGLVFMILLVIIIAPTFLRAVDGAYSPVTIASSSVSLREYRGDWHEALSWINLNVPKGTAVVCWWDYGYWVAIEGNSTSVADNATLYTDQIADVGQILLSNETEAFRLSRKYFNTDYILIFIATAPTADGTHMPWGQGDEGKWVWMADIAHGYHPEISRTSVDKDPQDGFPDRDTLLGKMLLYSIGRPVQLENSDIVFVSSSRAFLGTMKPTSQVIILKGRG